MVLVFEILTDALIFFILFIPVKTNQKEIWKTYMVIKSTLREVSVFGVILVRIFPYLDGKRRDMEYSVRMRENTDQNSLEHWHVVTGFN